MRKTFPGYYHPSEADIVRIWNTAVFSFDANVILNLYQFSPSSRALFFEILSTVKERIYITHQAAAEYHAHIWDRINVQVKLYEAGELNGFINKLENHVQQMKEHPILDYVALSKFVHDTKANLSALVSDRTALKKYYEDCDSIRNRVADLFEDKVGPPFNEEQLAQKFLEAKIRIEKKIPPGYKDAEKPEPQRYGDILMWYQLMWFAQRAEIKNPLIFVTDEQKEDWWIIRGGQTVSARPELIDEMLKTASVQVLIYSSEQFMAEATTKLNIATNYGAIDNALSELKTIKRQRDDAPDETRSAKVLRRRVRKVLLVNCPSCFEKQLRISDESVACLKCGYRSKDPREAFLENYEHPPISFPDAITRPEISTCCGKELKLVFQEVDKDGIEGAFQTICFVCGAHQEF